MIIPKNKITYVKFIATLLIWLATSAQAQSQLDIPGFGPDAASTDGAGGFGQENQASLTLSAQADRSNAHPGGKIIIALEVQVRPGLHIYPQNAKIDRTIEVLEYAEATAITIPSDGVKGFKIGKIIWPTPKPHPGEPVAYLRGKFTILAEILIDQNVKPGALSIPLNLYSQACEDRASCFPSENVKVKIPIQIVAQTQPLSPIKTQSPFNRWDENKAQLQKNTVESAASQLKMSLPWGGHFVLDTRGAGFYLLLLLAAAGGLALNFMPCVLPVIPIKILGLQKSAGTRAKSIYLGSLMSLGVIVFWVILGLVVVAFQTGTSKLFGYWQFNVAVGLFIAIMAVGMGGLFAIRLPNFVYKVSPKHDSASGAFGFGVMTAVLATPCTAPFAGAAMGWASTQTQYVSFMVFLSVGVGMAIPYILLAAFPKLIDKLPRTGPASDLLKQVLSLMMIGAAVYFLGSGIAVVLAEPGYAPEELLIKLTVVGIVACSGLWLAYRSLAIGRFKKTAIFFSSAGLATFALMLLLGWSIYNEPHIRWNMPYTKAKVQQGLKDNKVVVLEFTANWCVNCKALEKSVLHTQAVAKMLNDKRVLPIKVDLSNDAFTAGWDVLKKDFQMLGPPLLVIYTPDGKVIMKSSLYTADELLTNLRKALGDKTTDSR